MRSTFLLTVVSLTPLFWGPCVAAADGDTARIVVDPGEEIGPVNRLILGNNMLAYQGRKDDRYGNRGAGTWDPDRRRPVPEYVKLARQAGISVSRWPGGCGTHNYNWKATVGPLGKRPDQQFGLPEFLEFCDAVGSIPILTVAVYWGGPQDAADLVEYLNAPNDGKNPNGGVDWAAVRAADGHPAPYNVIWFEYGNESYHGEHRPTEGRKEKRKFSPEEYARRYREYRSAMKAVDPSIKLGALIQFGERKWNEKVLRIAGPEIDFGIEHTYLPALYGDATEVKPRSVMRACVACDAQLQRVYDRLNELVQRETGRTDLQWAITEYNGHFVQNKPVPYRQTLGNALRNAEHIRVMMQPRNRIVLANFWQFANEYWGMVRGYVHKGETPVKQANFYVYQLYNEHFGDTLVATRVSCGQWDFPGGARVRPRFGKRTEFKLFDADLLPQDYRWSTSRNPLVKQRIEGRVLVAEFSGKDTNYYHANLKLPAKPRTGYRVTGEIKTSALRTGQGVGFQVGDGRGYEATRSYAIGGDVRGDSDWTEVAVDYVTLADAEEIMIQTRRVGHDGGADPIRGRAYFRLVRVQEFQPANFGAVPDLSVNAAKRAGGAITLMIVNTRFETDIATAIQVQGLRPGAASRATAWSLVGPTPWATNVGAKQEVGLVETPVRKESDAWRIVLPRHSLTAVEIQP
ncbi:MAG: hypothetical protein GXP31_17730 [Kiritimatiellaeota bacterium]|nr:hypothetical protein [Kiritimatiellota bacterium]